MKATIITRRNLLIFAISFTVLLLLPRVLGFSSERLTSFNYQKVFAENLWGKHYKCPLECPSPFMIFLLAIFTEPFVYILASASKAIGVVAVISLIQELGGSFLAGILAAAVIFIGNKESFIGTLVSTGYGDFYIPLVFLLLLYIKKAEFVKASLCILAAGLLRPEAWLFNIIFIIVLKLACR